MNKPKPVKFDDLTYDEVVSRIESFTEKELQEKLEEAKKEARIERIKDICVEEITDELLKKRFEIVE